MGSSKIMCENVNYDTYNMEDLKQQIRRHGSMKLVSTKRRANPQKEEASITHEGFLKAKRARLEALILKEEKRRKKEQKQ